MGVSTICLDIVLLSSGQGGGLWIRFVQYDDANQRVSTNLHIMGAMNGSKSSMFVHFVHNRDSISTPPFKKVAVDIKDFETEVYRSTEDDAASRQFIQRYTSDYTDVVSNREFYVAFHAEDPTMKYALALPFLVVLEVQHCRSAFAPVHQMEFDMGTTLKEGPDCTTRRKFSSIQFP